MKFNVARQSLLAGFLTLITLTVMALVRSHITPLESIDGMQAPLERLLSVFESAYPMLSHFIGAILILFSGLYIGRFTIRYGFYPFKTCLPMSLYGIMVCVVYASGEYLAVYLASTLLVLSLKYFYAALRSGYSFSQLFRGSALLGLIPLVYSPTLPLLLLVIAVGLVFKRTLREFIVSLSGVVLPLFAVSYLSWALGADFTATVTNLWQAMIVDNGHVLFQGMSPIVITMLCLLLFITVCSIFSYLADARSTAFKARSMLLLDIIAFILILSMLFLPGSTYGIMLLAAVPAAMIMPIMFVRINRILSLFLYISLLVLCVLNIF